MANITVTTVGSSVEVSFGNYWRGSGHAFAHPDVNASDAKYRRAYIARVWREGAGTQVKVWMEGETREWVLGVAPQQLGEFVVDTVDGVSPTDYDDLFDKIKALMP